MENGDWERFGEEIRRSVQEAVDSWDFSRLNQTITNTIDAAMHGGQRTSRGVDPVGFDQDLGYKYNETKEAGRTGRENHGSSYTHTDGDTHRDAYGETGVELYGKTTGAKAGGIALAIAGGGIGIVFLGMSLMLAVVQLLTGGIVSAGFWALIVTFGVLFLVGTGIAAGGVKKLGLVKRFRNYQKILGSREYCDLKELAEQTGEKPKQVLKDVKKMIESGWFSQGRLDAQEKCLMLSDQAYEQYRSVMEEYRKRQEETKAGKAESGATAGAAKDKKVQSTEGVTSEERKKDLSPEVEAIVRKGEEYIRKIHACNDAIPGEEISAKIARMELLIGRIFDRVEQNPQVVGETQKLMSYYLPTTLKLLEAYEELDRQPVQGENIATSKREIEETLDTLNTAFEKLLDSLFQETAWDVSSDISVLKMMLAQEGLGPDDFQKKEE